MDLSVVRTTGVGALSMNYEDTASSEDSEEDTGKEGRLIYNHNTGKYQKVLVN